MTADPRDVPEPVRVLVADDDPHVRLALRELLETDGRFDLVASVPDGRAASRALAEQRVDVVVLDLRMPTGGLDLVRWINVHHRSCAVVVFSAHAPSQGPALAAGADAFVHKGDPTVDLRAVVTGVAVTRWRHPSAPPRDAAG